MQIAKQVATYRKMSVAPAPVVIATAMIARPSIFLLAPSCAIPSVSGRSSPTKGRGARYLECPIPDEAFAQEGHFPAQRTPPSILPNPFLQTELSALGMHGLPHLRTIRKFPRH